jgi:hypothetical protein
MRRVTVIVVTLLAAGTLRAEGPRDAGASISVSVTDGGDTTLEVKRGDLKVSAGGEQTHVSAGQAVHVKKGQRAKKSSLLGAPANVQPADGQHLNATEVALSWAPVEHAARYKVIIASNAKLDKPVHEATATAEVHSTVKLPAGTWYWRVVAVDKDGLEGRPSTQMFVVDTTPPTLKPGKPRWK